MRDSSILLLWSLSVKGQDLEVSIVFIIVLLEIPTHNDVYSDKYSCFYSGVGRESIMDGLSGRIKKARTDLHLSQDYVANYLGIGRSAVAEIESGRRSVKADELGKLSDLFLIPADSLLKGTEGTVPSQMFARAFDQLAEEDQQEILNLIEFKRAMKARR